MAFLSLVGENSSSSALSVRHDKPDSVNTTKMTTRLSLQCHWYILFNILLHTRADYCIPCLPLYLSFYHRSKSNIKFQLPFLFHIK